MNTYQVVTTILLVASLATFLRLALPDVRDAIRARALERGGRR